MWRVKSVCLQPLLYAVIILAADTAELLQQIRMELITERKLNIINANRVKLCPYPWTTN